MTDIIAVDDQGKPVHSLTAEKSIAERLRFEAGSADCISDPDPSLWTRAADEIESQAKRIAELETKNQNLWSTVHSKQARIDALMLEFCPGEMSDSQRKEWGENQRVAPPEVAHNSVCQEADGCPAEMIVLKRFWRAHRVRLPEPPVVTPDHELSKYLAHLAGCMRNVLQMARYALDRDGAAMMVFARDAEAIQKAAARLAIEKEARPLNEIERGVLDRALKRSVAIVPDETEGSQS